MRNSKYTQVLVQACFRRHNPSSEVIEHKKMKLLTSLGAKPQVTQTSL